jgi:hypothetical protein
MQELDLIEQEIDISKRGSQVPRRPLLQFSKAITEKLTIPSTQPKKTCHVCRDPIERNGSVLNGKYYHSEHFKCKQCQFSLKNIPCYEMDGNLWCERDYHKKYSPECHYCHEPIKLVYEYKLGRNRGNWENLP